MSEICIEPYIDWIKPYKWLNMTKREVKIPNFPKRRKNTNKITNFLIILFTFFKGCDKDFKRKCDMNSHIISSAHLNIQKYQCQVCNQAFNSLSNCIRHKRQLHPAEYEIERREKESLKKPKTS